MSKYKNHLSASFQVRVLSKRDTQVFSIASFQCKNYLTFVKSVYLTAGDLKTWSSNGNAKAVLHLNQKDFA